jgi:hypothetical protein
VVPESKFVTKKGKKKVESVAPVQKVSAPASPSRDSDHAEKPE